MFVERMITQMKQHVVWVNSWWVFDKAGNRSSFHYPSNSNGSFSYMMMKYNTKNLNLGKRNKKNSAMIKSTLNLKSGAPGLPTPSHGEANRKNQFNAWDPERQTYQWSFSELDASFEILDMQVSTGKLRKVRILIKMTMERGFPGGVVECIGKKWEKK